MVINDVQELHRPSSLQPFSSIDFVVQCMLDRTRTEAFERAITASVQPGMRVLDLGTGTGVLALLAARAGAGSVLALECDPHIASVARANISANDWGHVVKVAVADARDYDFAPGEHFDVVVAEMLTTGVVDEYQVQAINNLHRQGVVDASTLFIPEAHETRCALGFYSFERYGFSFPIVHHVWRFMVEHDPVFHAHTEPLVLSNLDFRQVNDEQVAARLRFVANHPGVVNCLYLSSTTTLGPDIHLGDTDSLNAPIAIPFGLVRLAEGEPLCAVVRYVYGGGYERFSAVVER